MIFNRKGNRKSYYYKRDLSIEKDAERVLSLAKSAKKYLDEKYKNGYKLVSVGNSHAPITETMKLLGCDTYTIPFSTSAFDCKTYDYPYKRAVYKRTKVSNVTLYISYKTEDWRKFFEYHGINADFSEKTGKTLLFTDYISEGNTKKVIEQILNHLGFDKSKTEFLSSEELFEIYENVNKIMDFNLDYSLYSGEMKKYSLKTSPKEVKFLTDTIIHPEYIENLPEKLPGKLFRFALYELLHKKM